jgi:hypothetical protein
MTPHCRASSNALASSMIPGDSMPMSFANEESDA